MFLVLLLQDPNTNKIKQLRNLTDTTGVITKFMLMDSQPVLGDWKIKVSAHVSKFAYAKCLVEFKSS